MYKNYTGKCPVASRYTILLPLLSLGKKFLASPAKRQFIMRANMTIAFLIAAIMQVSASGYAQKITINQKNTNLKTVFDQLAKQSGYDFIYDGAILNSTKNLDVHLNSVSFETALAYCFRDQPLSYKIEAGIVVIKSNNPFEGKFQQQKITGTVSDQEGKALVGATVQVLGKNILKLNTDREGNFTFNNLVTDTAIKVSFIGYRTHTVKIVPGKTSYKISLTSTDANLKDVVITGMFDKPKESFTGAITVISKEQIKLFGNRNLIKTIGNIDPSFDIQENNQYGSDPNAVPMIEIRGSSTLPSDISNIQATNVRQLLNLPLFILDGFEVTEQRVLDMNQNDVESVVILKDASATASYGSRGANGVVVITSLKPEKGKLRISYTAGVNLELPDVSSYNLLNATDKLALEKRAGLYTSTSLSSQLALDDLYNRNYKAVAEGVNTNWAKVPVKTGVGQFHSLNLSGGDSEFRYSVNGSYNQIKGAMKGSSRNNFNGGMQIGYTMKNVLFTNNLSVGQNNSAESPYGNFGDYVIMNPYWSPTDANGKYTQLSFDRPDFQVQDNIAYNATLNGFQTTNYTVVRNNTNVDWTIFNGLKWSNSASVSKQMGGADNFTPPSNLLFKNTDVASKGTYVKTNSTDQSYQFRSNVSYGTVFGKNSIYTGINAQIRESKTSASTISVKGFNSDTYSDISYAASYSGDRPSTNEYTTRNLDFSATGSYNWDSRIFFDANYNLTGSSSFGPNSRFGKYFSVGAGYNLSNEQFMKDKLPFINKFKMRANYGIVGGVNFQPYQALTTYTYDRTVSYRLQTGATVSAFGNEDLRAQNTQQKNFGLDIDLFKGWLTFSGNEYIKNTKNAITSATLSGSHGFSSIVENIGEVKNTGMDLTIQAFIIKNPERGFSWSVRAASYANRNVLVKLSDALKKASKLYEGFNSNSVIYNEYIEGRSLDEIYVLVSPGVDASTGQALYLNANGQITTSVEGYSKVAVGNSQPKFNGRFSTMVSYKGFVANIGFAGRFGGKKLNQTLLFKVENANVINNVDSRVLDLRWVKPGDVTGFKALGDINSTTYANNRFVFTENTVTLNSVSLSYDLPQKLVKRLDMTRVSFSATMSDLFYWSNIEMERGSDYPYSLKPSFTLSCSF